MFNYVILPLIALHVTVNVLYGILKKDPLVRAMVTGKKPAAAYEDSREAVLVERPVLRALLCLAIACAIIFGAISALGGKPFY
jgi:hypothetical protein